jgi:hypothetical protein
MRDLRSSINYILIKSYMYMSADIEFQVEASFNYNREYEISASLACLGKTIAQFSAMFACVRTNIFQCWIYKTGRLSQNTYGENCIGYKFCGLFSFEVSSKVFLIW